MSQSSSANQLPSTLSLAYEAQEKLASSPGKATWLALDRQTREPVIIKLLFFDQHFDWQHHKLFEREAKVLNHLAHPSLPKFIKVIDFQDEKNNGFASVQSYIPAKSLERHLNQGRTFSEKELKELAQIILEILDFLHRQNPPIIHRDIKPSNILLGDRSANSIGEVFLVDFDAVQTVITPGSTRTVVGSYGYMPPEQFGGRSSPASDLYALGATLIRIATGHQPADIPEENLKLQFEPFVQLSPEFVAWINHAIEPSLEKRFLSANEALDALIDTLGEPLIQSTGSDAEQHLSQSLQQKNRKYIRYQQSEYGLSIAILSSLNGALIVTIIQLCIVFFSIFIVILQYFPVILFLSLVVMGVFLTGITTVFCLPEVHTFYKFLAKWVWPYFGTYRINVDRYHLTIKFRVFGFTHYYAKYLLKDIVSLEFSDQLQILSPNLLKNQQHEILAIRQNVEIALKPFLNLEPHEIKEIQQVLLPWIKVSLESYSRNHDLR